MKSRKTSVVGTLVTPDGSVKARRGSHRMPASNN